MASNLNFETFAQEAHEYINELAQQFGHPEEKARTLIVWRSVMHTLRDRIHYGESFQVFAPLPMILKGIYVENWKYTEKPPKDYETVEEMKQEVKNFQKQYGEQEFDWGKPTEEIISITLKSLDRFLQGDQLSHVKDQMPKDVQRLFE